MKNTNKKRGFTIIELVIVVAVIAILTAVLVPTFTGLINKANEATDTALIKNLNTALAADVDGCDTMSEALAAAAEQGFDVAKISAKASDNKILWDSVNNVFCYEKNGEISYIPDYKGSADTADVDYWVIASTPSTKYSTYLYGASGAITASTGIDVGNCDITSIKYENTTGPAQTVTIYTNSSSSTLTINAPNDTVNHYGALGTLNIEDIAYDCFYEYGKTAYAKVDDGKIIVNKSAQISVLYTTSASVVIEQKNGGKIEGAYCVADSAPTNSNVDFVVKTVDEINTLADNAKTEAVREEYANSENYFVTIGTTPYASIQEAIENASNGDTIVLLKDVNVDSSIPVDKQITVDMNSHKIKGTGEDVFILTNQLTVKGNGTIEFLGEYDIFYLQQGGSLVIEDGNYISSTNVIYTEGCDNIEINGGMFNSSGANGVFYITSANVVINDGIFNYDGATGSVFGDGFQYGYAFTTSTTAVNGGTFNSEIYSLEGTTVIEGGEFNKVVSFNGNESSWNGNYTINGGSFTLGTTPFIVTAPYDRSVLTITGGTFAYIAGEEDAYGFSHAFSSRGKVAITGGTFGFNPEETYYSYKSGEFYREAYNSVSEGYSASDNGNGTWTVTASN